MKKILSVITAVLVLSSAVASAAEQKEVKTGWTVGLLPALTYSTDMGLQYGAFGHFYYHGDGSRYPDPLHDIGWEISTFTQGRTRYFLSYDSKYLIPGLRVSGSAMYVTDPLYNFYGFNGEASVYNADMASNKDTGVNYYGMKRNMFRGLADVQGQITKELKWCAGLSYWHLDIGDMDEKYGYNKLMTMYKTYSTLGVIKPSEVNGGDRLELKAGLCYDSRNFEAAPDKGIWADLYLNGSPDLFGDGFNYLKLCAHFRHYVTLPFSMRAGKPVFAYHLAYQGTVAGEVPFYMQQNVTTLILKQMMSEGLGSSNTIRGTYANRIIADGFAWGNFELRLKLVRFKFAGQFFYVAVNPFLDCGIVTQPYRVDEMALVPDVIANAVKAGYHDSKKYIQDSVNDFVCTAGAGLKIAWNENFIVSAEAGHNFNQTLGGPFWLSIGTNYCF